MTTLTKYKQEKYFEIESLANEIIQTRLKVVEASQLADEFKAETDQGLSLHYPEMSLHYGKQRAILRGLTGSDVMYFDLPTVAEWSIVTSFTMPSRMKFGYIFVDSDGNDSRIDDPELYYLTRKKSDNTLSTIENDSDAFSYPSVLLGFSQEIIAINSITEKYEIPLTFPATPRSLKVYFNGVGIGQDNGNGSITSPMLESGTVIYDEKVILDFGYRVGKGSIIKITYDTYTGVDQFNENYEQVNFGITQKVDFNQTLNLINLGQGVISKEPELTNTMYLRRKSDHQQVGIVQVVCEGLVTNSDWDTLTGAPEDYLRITHDQFKTLLGYLNPYIENDLTKSANPEIVSNGRESGGYPDIEASPFFPWTDGTYLGSLPYTGNYVHSEEGVDKWSVHPDIKWQYGTAPASLGQTTQEDPDTFLAALNAIDSFSGSGNNPVPDDTSGSGGSTYYTYAMSGNYVYKYTHTWGGGVYPEGSYSTSGSELSCYYNDVQHLKEDHLTHLQTQCGLIATLGDLANIIDVARQSTDTQFLTDTATFKTVLDAFISYHDAFDPISGRPTYDTSEMTTLKAATEPSAYLDQFTARVSDLDTTIGTATTSGYSKIIYDSVTMATHMDIGYLRDLIDELNSIQDLYSIITDLQSQYALLP